MEFTKHEGGTVGQQIVRQGLMSRKRWHSWMAPNHVNMPHVDWFFFHTLPFPPNHEGKTSLKERFNETERITFSMRYWTFDHLFDSSWPVNLKGYSSKMLLIVLPMFYLTSRAGKHVRPVKTSCIVWVDSITHFTISIPLNILKIKTHKQMKKCMKFIKLTSLRILSRLGGRLKKAYMLYSGVTFRHP